MESDSRNKIRAGRSFFCCILLVVLGLYLSSDWVSLSGVLICLTGSLFNLVVVYANNGWMPAVLQDEKDWKFVQHQGCYKPMESTDKFKLLCDRLHPGELFTLWKYSDCVSIGDLLMETGIFIFCLRTIIFSLA